MPQQKGTHLEPENAGDNFHFHFAGGVHCCTQMTQWMRRRTPGVAGGLIDTQQALEIQGVRVLGA